MRQITFMSLALVMIAVACKQEVSNPELKQMYDEVMEIHDEVMPKMRDIHRAKRSLRNSVEGENVPEVDSLIHLLETADESMMDWMAQFKKPPNDDIEAAKSYYRDQMQKMIQVKEDMLNALSAAEGYNARQ